jgi:hypothetical protein
MKRLLLLALFALSLSAVRASAQVPVLLTYFCVGGTYDTDEEFTCYISMEGYIVYARMEVDGYCSNNGAPIAGQGVFGACGSGFYPTATGQGIVNWGVPFVPGAQGRVTAFAKLTNYPGNPEALTTTDCYGYTSQSIEPILPC